MSKVSPGTLLLAIVAVMAGLLGAYIVKQNLQPKEVAAEEPAPEPEVLIVPLASTDLKAGREITLGDIAIYRLTAEQVKEQGIDGPYMNNTQQIIGRVLREDLDKGNPFETSWFYPEGMGPGVADLLAPGMRAITVPVELDAAVAGFATPGTWVDVLFRSKSSTDTNVPEVAVTLLERVQVLAVDQETFEGRRGRPSNRTESASVTLAVAPDEATALRVVDGRGTLALSLRHPDDQVSYASQNPLSLDKLLNIPKVKTHKMEVFRGRQVSRIDFETRRTSSPNMSRVVNVDSVSPATPQDTLTSAPATSPSIPAAANGDENK